MGGGGGVRQFSHIRLGNMYVMQVRVDFYITQLAST